MIQRRLKICMVGGWWPVHNTECELLFVTLDVCPHTLYFRTNYTNRYLMTPDIPQVITTRNEELVLQRLRRYDRDP